MKQRISTLEQSYREGYQKLLDAGVEDASIDAWYLLEYVTGVSKTRYYGNPTGSITAEQLQEYESYIELRCKRIPLQHITNEQVFMGYPFYVNQYVLVPRQDTEILVEEALKLLKPGMEVLDMCTGSGCILISLLKLKEAIQGTGCDLSEEALAVARKNAESLQVEAAFLKSDLFSEVTGRYDMIVSNPPYIPTAVIKGLQEEVRLHDPMMALDGKEDGLYFYRKIVLDSQRHLKDRGYLLFEIGHDQGAAVSGLLRDAGYQDVVVKKDLAGLDRVVIAMYNKE